LQNPFEACTNLNLYPPRRLENVLFFVRFKRLRDLFLNESSIRPIAVEVLVIL